MPRALAPHRPRLVVVGARQERHGLGAHLARHLAAAGAEIVAVVGSRLATAQRAAAALEPLLGHRPVPLAHSDDVERLPDLHAIAIAAPHEVHAPWLRWAVGRGLHVLCEKPLVWGTPEATSVAGAPARPAPVGAGAVAAGAGGLRAPAPGGRPRGSPQPRAGAPAALARAADGARQPAACAEPRLRALPRR
ncbi:MAG: Gfo/Idh/MocA family oxidoreductase, partial [Planctomycetia bacterium]